MNKQSQSQYHGSTAMVSINGRRDDERWRCFITHPRLGLCTSTPIKSIEHITSLFMNKFNCSHVTPRMGVLWVHTRRSIRRRSQKSDMLLGFRHTIIRSTVRTPPTKAPSSHLRHISTPRPSSTQVQHLSKRHILKARPLPADQQLQARVLPSCQEQTLLHKCW